MSILMIIFLSILPYSWDATFICDLWESNREPYNYHAGKIKEKYGQEEEQSVASRKT